MLKRLAILHALRSSLGRVLELGAGNGSNRRSLAARALRRDVTEATAKGTDLVRRAIAEFRPRSRASRLVVPGPPPRSLYDAMIVAVLLYYLNVRTMHRLARQVAGNLRIGGTLVLVHHRITLYNFVQHPEGI